MAGFNIGTRNMRAAAGKNIKVISCRPVNNDLTPLREDTEIFLDDFCTSCIISMNTAERSNDYATRLARSAGISDFKIISEADAMAAYCEFYNKEFFNKDLKRFLIIDSGAGAAKLTVIDLMKEPEDGAAMKYEIIENTCVESVSGGKFDMAVAEWLKNLLPDNIDNNINNKNNINMPGREQFKFLLSEAERIKISLSASSEMKWIFGNSEFIIYRDDIERLIRFQIRELAHTVRRIVLIHRPDKIFLTGGTSNIPIFKNILKEILSDILKNTKHNEKFLVFCLEDLVSCGTEIYAQHKNKNQIKINDAKAKKHNKNYDYINRLKELKLLLIDIENALNRQQKDRLYLLFQRAENSRLEDVHNQDLMKLYGGLVKDLSKAAAN